MTDQQRPEPDTEGTGASAAKAQTAPHPDDDRKPDSPTELTKPSWKFVLSRTVAEFTKDQCTDLAAALTYYSVLALFPAVLALVSLLGVFGQGPGTVTAILDLGRQAGMDTVLSQVEGPLNELVASQQAAGFALVVGLLVALWSASKYVGAFGRAMNRIYEVDEGRPIWKLRPAHFLITLALVVVVAAVAVGLVVSGPVARTVGDVVGLGDLTVTIWSIAKWPLMLILVVMLVALLYYATPNVKQPKFRWLSVGAALAILTWIVASAGFAFYVSNFGSYNKTYGSLAGVIIFLLWLWLTNTALLLGAELDAELERGRQLQAGIEAEHTLQLPPRDDSVSKKREAKLEKAIEKARAIRHSHGESSAPDTVDLRDHDDGQDRDADGRDRGSEDRDRGGERRRSRHRASTRRGS